MSLLREMCTDNSLNCIEAVWKEISFELLLHGLLDDRLPAKARAEFANLCPTLYSACTPHTIRQRPARVRVLDEITRVGDGPPKQPGAVNTHQKELGSGGDGGREAEGTAFLGASPAQIAALEWCVRRHVEALEGCQVKEARGANALTANLTEIAQL